MTDLASFIEPLFFFFSFFRQTFLCHLPSYNKVFQPSGNSASLRQSKLKLHTYFLSHYFLFNQIKAVCLKNIFSTLYVFVESFYRVCHFDCRSTLLFSSLFLLLALTSAVPNKVSCSVAVKLKLMVISIAVEVIMDVIWRAAQFSLCPVSHSHWIFPFSAVPKICSDLLFFSLWPYFSLELISKGPFLYFIFRQYSLSFKHRNMRTVTA